MNEPTGSDESQDRRDEPRESLERFYSIEMVIGNASAYQFKLRNISKNGLCILVREDSAALEEFSVGDVYKVKFYQDGDPQPAKLAAAEVRHITPQTEGRYQGHYLIGLSVKPDSAPGA